MEISKTLSYILITLITNLTNLYNIYNDVCILIHPYTILASCFDLIIYIFNNVIVNIFHISKYVL